MEVKKQRRLTLKERVIIQTLLREKKSKSYIAIRLGRTRSTIGREVNKWVQKKQDNYDAELSHWCAKEDVKNSTFGWGIYIAYRESNIDCREIKKKVQGGSAKMSRKGPKRLKKTKKNRNWHF
jgi:hypothetical protein